MAAPEPLLEICVDNIFSIRNAIEGGANRLELCSALSEGGLTPSSGLVKLAKRFSPVPIFAMIRLRAGDFVYEPEEIDAMLDDLIHLKSIGVDGFVFGALSPSGQPDLDACRRVIEAARPLPVTFHRAFDVAAEPLVALDTIRDLGFGRILTSGQRASAEDGLELISRLVERAGNEVVIMPGAGITERNLALVRDKSGAREFHGSAKTTSPPVKGATLTDPRVVAAMARILKESL